MLFGIYHFLASSFIINFNFVFVGCPWAHGRFICASWHASTAAFAGIHWFTCSLGLKARWNTSVTLLVHCRHANNSYLPTTEILIQNIREMIFMPSICYWSITMSLSFSSGIKTWTCLMSSWHLLWEEIIFLQVMMVSQLPEKYLQFL
jgi:hypothetical protein